jgi:hypothetical protein
MYIMELIKATEEKWSRERRTGTGQSRDPDW